jgi:hypothetical protein
VVDLPAATACRARATAVLATTARSIEDRRKREIRGFEGIEIEEIGSESICSGDELAKYVGCDGDEIVMNEP